MSSPHTLSLVCALAEREGRGVAAAGLAESLGATALIIFIRDVEIDLLVPAPGFPQTIPGGPSWDAFLADCREPGPRRANVAYPDGGTLVSAVAHVTGDGTVIVLLGGAPSPLNPEELALPLIGALLRAEQRASTAAAQAGASREAAKRAGALTVALDGARLENEHALLQAK